MSAIDNSVSQLQWIFTIVMSLAITEGLKQFVREDRDTQDNQPLRWHCFFGFVGLLLTAMPYTYGMTRYFFVAYRVKAGGALADNYSIHLALDTLAFTVEAVCLFIMSRSIAPVRSRTFAEAALVVFTVDTVWVYKCSLFGLPSHEKSATWWVVSDPIIFALLIGLIVAHRCCRRFGTTALYIAVNAILCAEPFFDFPLNWKCYFPGT